MSGYASNSDVRDRVAYVCYADAVQNSVISAKRRDATKRVGLSHGDRACLALAKKMGLPAVTADRAWAEIADAIGVEVVLIR
ncbi:MAG: hypothetical protein ABF812_16325 [Gluconobacter cerinus]|uniref:hypothetical protein n=1 Tax=Gluconobacter TaxID=441 RepID=UPI0031F9420A